MPIRAGYMSPASKSEVVRGINYSLDIAQVRSCLLAIMLHGLGEYIKRKDQPFT